MFASCPLRHQIGHLPLSFKALSSLRRDQSIIIWSLQVPDYQSAGRGNVYHSGVDRRLVHVVAPGLLWQMVAQLLKKLPEMY